MIDDLEVERFELQDINEHQKIELSTCYDIKESVTVRFLSSSDFHGRVLLYKLGLLGI